MSCLKRDASPGSMHDAGCLGLVHWDDPEGWYGEGGGRRVQDGFSFKNKKKKRNDGICILCLFHFLLCGFGHSFNILNLNFSSCKMGLIIVAKYNYVYKKQM